MKVLQPIEWVVDGMTKKGIVTEVLGDKKGVIARAIDNPNEAVQVAEPHKIRDLKAMAEVWKALGIKPDMVSKGGFITEQKPVHKGFKKVVIAPPTPKTEAELKGAYDKALEALGGEEVAPTLADIFGHEPTMGDWLTVYGSGCEVEVELPKAATTGVTPVDKVLPLAKDQKKKDWLGN